MELKSASHTKDLTIHATDGEIGNIDDFYFDDETWTIRYLIVTTGNWLSRRPVLISPMFVAHADWDAKQLHLSLTKEQIKNSPHIDTRKPISRQEEAAYQISFGNSYYWGGTDLWGFGPYPMNLAAARMPREANPLLAANESPDSHLRSTNEVHGYHVLAADGEVGHVEDFILDQETWSIRYLEVDTRNWWPGKTVLIAPDWVEKVSWVDSQVAVAVSKETIRGSPEYIESRPITRAYEARLHEHYGHVPYWMWEAGRPPMRRPRQGLSV
jgi:uncharacterized protein YrrD